jgi:phytanoyl-CoA hydroxylase
MKTSALAVSYKEQGYALIPGVYADADLRGLQACIESGVERHAQELVAKSQITDLHAAEPFDRRLASLYRGKDMGVRMWDEVVTPAALMELVRHPRLLDALEALLGSEITFSGDMHLRPKLPESSLTSFPWHQDSQYYGPPTAAMHIVTAWVPLVDVDTRNGCLWVMPGSQRWGLLRSERGADQNMRTFEDVEKRGTPVAIEMKRGDVLLFSNLTFHGSKLNLTQTVRWSIDLRFHATPGHRRVSNAEREAIAFYNGKLQAYGRSGGVVRSQSAVGAR